jgi:hypothetical protein
MTLGQHWGNKRCRNELRSQSGGKLTSGRAVSSGMLGARSIAAASGWGGSLL